MHKSLRAIDNEINTLQNKLAMLRRGYVLGVEMSTELNNALNNLCEQINRAVPTQSFASLQAGYMYQTIGHALRAYKNPHVNDYLDEIATHLKDNVNGCNRILSKNLVKDGVFGIELECNDFNIVVFNCAAPNEGDQSYSIKFVKKMRSKVSAPNDDDLDSLKDKAEIKQNLKSFRDLVESENFGYQNKHTWKSALEYYNGVMHSMIRCIWNSEFNARFRVILHTTRGFMDHKLASRGCFYCLDSWEANKTWYLATVSDRPRTRAEIQTSLPDWSQRLGFPLEEKLNTFNTTVETIQVGDTTSMERSLILYDEIMFTLYNITLWSRFNKASEGMAEYVRRYMNSILEDKGLIYIMYTPESTGRNAKHARWFLIMQY